MNRTSGLWKWWIAVVLFLATVLTYLDRQTLSLCGPMICQEFDLSNEDYGKLVAAFRWAYAVVHVPAGFIADRFSLRITYSLAVGLWSAAGAAAALILGGATIAGHSIRARRGRGIQLALRHAEGSPRSAAGFDKSCCIRAFGCCC
jgi:sugar phosphate permease